MTMYQALRTLLVATLGATLVQAQGPAPPMPAGTNVLLGRVLEVGTDTPVSGAIVTLTGHFDASGQPATPNPAARGSDLPPSLNVMTSAGGYFVFRHLPAGRFTAATRALGYMNSDYPPTLIDIQNSQKPVELQLHVWKYAAVGGRVFDERDEPITGIPVAALHRVPSGNGVLLRRSGTALTDDRGEYRISQLTPGDYVAAVLSTTTTLPENVAAALDPSPASRETSSTMTRELIQSGFLRTYGCPTCVSANQEGHQVSGFVLQRPGTPLPPAPDGRPLGFANTFYPGTPRASEANVISLASGESRADLDLVVRLAPTVTVAGVLAGPDGPMPHVALNLIPPGADLNDFDPVGISTAITDTRGAFVFLAVVPGDYTLSSSSLKVNNDAIGEGQSLWASQSLTVGDTDVTRLTVEMQPGVRMNGRVEFKNSSGAASRPSQRQVINLQPLRAQTWRTLQAVVQSDGTFRSAGDPPGRYTLNATSPPGWFWQTTTLASRPLTDEVIDLASSDISGLVLTFGPTTNRVSGRVSDSTGAADPDAAVIVFPADSSTWREGIFTSRRQRKVHATSAGLYDIATLAPGDYYVAAISTRLALNWQDPQLLERLIAGASSVTLGPEDQKTVALRTIALPGRGQ